MSLRILGGWDAILCTDPKDPLFYDDDELTVAGYVETGYSRLNLAPDLVATDVEGLTFGPYIGNLVDFANRTSVIRGMTVTSVAHEPAQIHLNTGNLLGWGRGPHPYRPFSPLFWVSEQLMPNLVSGVASYNLISRHGAAD